MIDNQAKWISIDEPEHRSETQAKNAWENRLSVDDQATWLEDNGGVVLLKRTFLAGQVKRATICATALGVFDIWCNGKRVGVKEDGETVYDELKPGWTDYRKRALCFSYELTPYLHDGENTLLAAVTGGWYCGRISCNTYEATHVSFICEVELEADDGTVSKIFTDESWQGTRGSAVRTSDIWDGELYDAREPLLCEISAGAEMKWESVLVDSYDIEISEQVGPSVRERRGLSRKPSFVKIYDGVKDNGTDFGELSLARDLGAADSFLLKAGERAVVDLGQNMVGYPAFKVRGARGARLRVRFGEMLNDSGSKSRGNDDAKESVYSLNYRSAKAKLEYILRGVDGGESYRPSFTFFGFRYLEISASEDIELLALECRVLGSDIREIGKLETSDPLVNQFISNVLWGQRSNYLSVPTDCPQRDERLGWTGDTQAFCGTAAYNADVRGFFEKWLMDLRDSQLENGEYPDVVPSVRVVGAGAAAWGDAGIIVPYKIWKMYGERDVIAGQYESMEKYMDWIATTDKKGARARYGDWLAYEKTDKSLISLAYYVMDAKYMSVMSDAIGKRDRAEHYACLAGELVEEFRRVWCDSRGMLLPDHRTQTGYLLALGLGLLPDDARGDAVEALKQKIIDNGYKLSTGFVGSCLLCETLAELGEMGLAYSLLLQRENPSWLYSVLQGATTIWERWNSYTKADGFGDVNMNSFNHYAYGAVQEWMYRHMAGIQTADNAPGFAHPIIAPKPDVRRPEEIPDGQSRITYVRASYESAAGLIETEWDTSDGFVLSVRVPVESTLHLPILTDSDTLRLNGETVKIKSEMMLGMRVMTVMLKPGCYIFEQK